jgi:carboxyl-terminal processing protease
MIKKLSLFGLLFGILLAVPAHLGDAWDESVEKMSTMISMIEENYFQEVKSEDLAYSSIRGMLLTLDPHSYFLDPSHLANMREEYVGKYFGLGIIITKQESRLTVVSPMEGGPGYRLGIQPGDVISHINGESTETLSSYDAMLLLRGPKNTEITITILREGMAEPFDMTIAREEIPLYSVPYAFKLREDVGYIFIRNFAETTVDEFEAKMKMLKNQGVRKLILDMRGNGGGSFPQSVDLADEFLPKGAEIVSMRGRSEYFNKSFQARRDNQYEDLPLVILINQATASAPEIVSGAVKDNDRALIVGEVSWGKGLVQTVFPLADNAALALTTAKYFTPSGRSIQRDFSRFEDYYIFKTEVPEDQREVKYTTKGRKVLGQGGIEPDYEVKFSFKDLTGTLLFKGSYFAYARQFKEHNTDLSKNFLMPEEKVPAGGSGKTRLEMGFSVDERFVEDFRKYLTGQKIEFKPEDFEEARDEIKRELERELYSLLWNIEEGTRMYRLTDPVVLKAIDVLSDAEKMIAGSK